MRYGALLIGLLAALAFGCTLEERDCPTTGCPSGLRCCVSCPGEGVPSCGVACPAYACPPRDAATDGALDGAYDAGPDHD
jgi:hypothetical protein